MRRLLAHVHARVKRADRPDGREPGEHERPARGPGGEVLDGPEDVASGVDRDVVDTVADGEGDHRRDDEPDVEEDAHRLDLGHDASEERRDQAVRRDAGDVRAVDDGARGSPGAVASKRDDREQHEGEAI